MLSWVSTRASRVVIGAPADDTGCTTIDAIFREGAENYRRGRRCSPKNPNPPLNLKRKMENSPERGK